MTRKGYHPMELILIGSILLTLIGFAGYSLEQHLKQQSIINRV